jgi:hypothetical protein
MTVIPTVFRRVCQIIVVSRTSTESQSCSAHKLRVTTRKSASSSGSIKLISQFDISVPVREKLTMGRRKIVQEVVVDPTEWMITNAFAEFVLFHTDEVKYMCMLGYTFMKGQWLRGVMYRKAALIG